MNKIISIIKAFFDVIESFFNGDIFMNVIREEQKEYRKKSGHILDKYDPDWEKGDYLW